MPWRLFVFPGNFPVPSWAEHNLNEEVDMDSGMIGKIEKSKRYAEEPERIRFEQFHVSFQGSHTSHSVSYNDGAWHCTCHFFATRGVCSHTMAMERVLGVMLPMDTAAAAEPLSAPAVA
jgi:hypothetical protein